MGKTGSFVLVVGHRALVDSPEGAAALLRQLGSEVRTLDLWDDFVNVVEQARADGEVRTMVFEAGERPDLAAAALRAARKVPELSETPTVVTLPPRQITSFDPASGFDDFIVMPCVPAELYARIRALEWRRSEFATEERLKIGALLVDRAAHEVSVEGRRVDPDGEGIRAPRLPRRQPRPGLLAGDVARACLGQPVRGRRAHGGHPRPAPARQAGRRAASRDPAWGRVQAARSERSRVSMTCDGARHGDVVSRAEARIAVSVGCPCGIGPEVSVVAAAAERGSRVLLVGDAGVILAAARGRGVAAKRLQRVSEPGQAWTLARGIVGIWQPGRDLAARDGKPGAPTRASGAAQLAWIDAACDLAASGQADALVTGPVSKEAIVRSKAPGAAEFLGHTEHLQRRLRAREVVMAFWSPELATSLATTHLPLARVPLAVTAAAGRARRLLARLAARADGRRARPRSPSRRSTRTRARGACSGARSGRASCRGSRSARSRLACVAASAATLDGPVPAESAFRLATAGAGAARRWSGVVAIYHDQATIPMKIAVFGEAVNVSLGLPIVRTSVDHGTAYDRAGTWTADARGMRAAIALATRLVGDRPGGATGGTRRKGTGRG